MTKLFHRDFSLKDFCTSATKKEISSCEKRKLDGTKCEKKLQEEENLKLEKVFVAVLSSQVP